MSISYAIGIDIVILLYILVQGGFGAKRGFVASVLRLVSYLVILAASVWVSNQFAPAVYYHVVQPIIMQNQQELLEDEIKQNADLVKADPGKVQEVLDKLPDAISSQIPPELLELIDEQTIDDFISGEAVFDQEAITASIVKGMETAARPLMIDLVQSVLFLISFSVLSIIANVIIKASNVINKVPVIGTANRLAGFAAGLLGGALQMMVLSKIIYVIFSSYLDVFDQTVLFKAMIEFNPLRFLLG